jgi:hypothetical protein
MAARQGAQLSTACLMADPLGQRRPGERSLGSRSRHDECPLADSETPGTRGFLHPPRAVTISTAAPSEVTAGIGEGSQASNPL